MKMRENGLWRYFEKWRSLDHGRDPLKWKGTWLENSWCADCRYCCGPQDTNEPFPMALLPEQLRPDLDKDFYLLSHDMAYLADKGCKADTSNGCRLSMKEKPVACGLFPIVLANGGLYLYQICPAAMFVPLAIFYDLAREAAMMLNKFSYENLLHLSLDLSDATLANKYVDLHIRIFDSHGKVFILE